MSEQLTLGLVLPLRYSSSAYLVHKGVASVVTTLTALCTKRSFSLTYVSGEAQAGKTHLSVYLVGEHHRRNGPARVIQGPSLVQWFTTELLVAPISAWELVVIDDADICLADAGAQGILVDLIERVARQKGTVVLTGASDPDAIKMSPQLRSRLQAGIYASIDDPHESDLDKLLDCITKQRGLQLSESKRAYILKRVERTIPAMVDCVERVEEGASVRDASSVISNSL